MQSLKSTLAGALSALALIGLSACSTPSPDVIKPGDAQRLSQVAELLDAREQGEGGNLLHGHGFRRVEARSLP